MRQEVILDALDMLDRDMIEAVDALREAGKCSEYGAGQFGEGKVRVDGRL